jgi:hypothetical protein
MLCANKNTIVRTAVIIYVPIYDVWHHFIATLRVHAIIGPCSEIYQHAYEKYGTKEGYSPVQIAARPSG